MLCHLVYVSVATTPMRDRDQEFCYENFCENSTEVHEMLLAFRDSPRSSASL